MRAAATAGPVLRRASLAAVAVVVLASGAVAQDQGAASERKAEGQTPGHVGAMLARPLFAPTRRPPPPPPLPPVSLQLPSAPRPPPSAPNVALSGVILEPGGGGVALVRGPLDPAPVRVRLGATVDGWTIAEIRPRAVVLRRDGRSATVDLPGAEH